MSEWVVPIRYELSTTVVVEAETAAEAQEAAHLELEFDATCDLINYETGKPRPARETATATKTVTVKKKRA